MPVLYILADPNGTGKTTFYSIAVETSFISNDLPFVNVDRIAQSLGGYPVNYSRAEEPDRKELLSYVSRLVNLRTPHPALSVNDTDFIHVDFNDGKRVVAWKRGTNDPVVIVANFSDYTTPDAFSPNAEYIVQHWPDTPAGQHWLEVTQNRSIAIGQ